VDVHALKCDAQQLRFFTIIDMYVHQLAQISTQYCKKKLKKKIKKNWVCCQGEGTFYVHFHCQAGSI